MQSHPQSVENACRVILRKAEGRGFVGGMMFLVRADGTMETILVGDLRHDLERAKDVADHGFKCLLDHEVCADEPSSKLPRRLRKETQNEPVVRPTVYRARCR